VDQDSVATTLARAESSLAAGDGLEGTGFWRAVSAARVQPELAAEFAERIAQIDREAFEKGVSLRVPAGVGTAALAAGTAGGLLALALADHLGSRLARTVVFLGAFGVLELTTHTLAHWVVGRAVGIKFTHYFLGGPPPPRPGAKIDYSSYLRVDPAKRAVMHASGAVVTKLIPFVLIPYAGKLQLGRWVSVALAGIGIVQIVTDVLLSTKTSDWKKVKRELRAARLRRQA
jgi:hypothetical protein